MRLIAPEGRLPWWIAVPTAALGGWMLDLANPGVGAWWLVFPAVLLMLASWWRQRLGVAALTGLAAGAAFWLPHISWLTLYLGPIPWLALGTVMTLWVLLQAMLTAVATRGITALGTQVFATPRPVVTLLLQAFVVAGIWVLREGVQGMWPYGGFAWGRIAHVFADSPVGPTVSWVGFAGLSGIIVCAVAIVASCMFAGIGGGEGPVETHVAEKTDIAETGAESSVRAGTFLHGRIVTLAVTCVVVAGLWFVPPAQLERTGSLRVAGIQGNSKSAIFDDRESGDVFADHVRATETLLDDLENSGDSVDLVVWPENAGEFGLNQNPLRGREVALLSQRADAPIALGTILQDEDGSYWNSSLVWGPRGQQLPETTSRYDKRFPVPFAEYMPNRDFFHALVPDLVDLVQLEYSFGQRPVVMPIETNVGTIDAAAAICFDIIFDDQAVQMVDGGAELILAQSNNADFGRTDESVQQLQIARLRAIETGRAVVNISTVGTSVIIAPDGSNLDSIEPYTAGAIIADVPLVAGSTPALQFGAAISTAWMLLGAGGILLGVGVSMRRLFRLRRGSSTFPEQA